ncbi:ribbon-helix-helix protein, CopG family [Geobacillus stearothermophilus]
MRLDDELYELLQKYYQTKNMSESEAVRQLISELKWKRF